MKLNTHEAQVAWEDFRGYLIDIGMLKNLDKLKDKPGLPGQEYWQERGRHNLAKMSFKQGFATGAITTPIEQPVYLNRKIAEVVKTEMVETFRTYRKPEQIEKDNRVLTSILANEIEPLKLGKIIDLMIAYGHHHWTTNNGSGFVKMAIKMGSPIECLERGVYVYSVEAKNTPQKV